MGLNLLHWQRKIAAPIAALVATLGLLLTGCGGSFATAAYSVSGAISGLGSGKTVVIQNASTNPLTSDIETDVLSISFSGSSAVAFTFPVVLARSSTYSVTVATQPDGQTCRVTNGSGTALGGAITDVAISCFDSGTSDFSFGSSGVVINASAASGVGADVGQSIVSDANGKILVVGSGWNGTNTDMVIWRYNSDGSLDTSFDTDGIVIHDNAAGGSGDDDGQSIALDGDGKILVTGSSQNGGDTDMVIWRYNSDGSLDTSFDTDGIVIHDNAAGGSGNDDGQSIALDGDGKILVTGSSQNGGDTDMVIWRYNSTGSLDTSFDTDGIVIHDNAAGGSGNDDGQSIVLDGDGKILVTGSSQNGANTDVVIWRYNSDGSLDTSFDTDGIVIHDNAAGGSGNDYGQSIALDGDGKILVTGSSQNGANTDMVIWRYNSTGSLDTSFDTDGIVIHDNAAGGSGNDDGQSIVLDGNGKILVTGSSQNGANTDMVIWRYNSDGTLDTNFDTDGIVIHHNAAGGGGNDYGQSIKLDEDGNVLVAGYSDSGVDDDLAIWRFIP